MAYYRLAGLSPKCSLLVGGDEIDIISCLGCGHSVIIVTCFKPVERMEFTVTIHALGWNASIKVSYVYGKKRFVKDFTVGISTVSGDFRTIINQCIENTYLMASKLA